MSIVDYQLSAVTQKEYMFTTDPGTFSFVILALVVALVGVGLSLLANWYFKKRRERFDLIVEQRKLIVRHARISIVIFSTYLLYVLLRVLGVSFLSMRFFGYFLLISSLINIVVGFAIVFTTKAKAEVMTGEESAILGYGKYLPKKKKK